MIENEIPHPPIVSPEEWAIERSKLLVQEKELTRQKDRVNAQRRRLPMVKIEKDYIFEGPEGNLHLRDLFGDARQLIIYHFIGEGARKPPRLVRGDELPVAVRRL